MCINMNKANTNACNFLRKVARIFYADYDRGCYAAGVHFQKPEGQGWESDV